MISKALYDTLVAVGIEMADTDKRRREFANTTIVRNEVLGIPTDFAIRTERTGGDFKITVACAFPRVAYNPDTNTVAVFPHD